MSKSAGLTETTEGKHWDTKQWIMILPAKMGGWAVYDRYPDDGGRTREPIAACSTLEDLARFLFPDFDANRIY